MYSRQVIIMAGRRAAIPERVLRELRGRTHCANHPLRFAPGCRDYICPLWRSGSGAFDESGRQIDHIVEVTKGGTNDLSNLQVLCPCCHAVKTKRCAKQSWEFTSPEIDTGVSYMDIDKPAPKKRKTGHVIE